MNALERGCLALVSVSLIACAGDALELPLEPDIFVPQALMARSDWSVPVPLDEINTPDAETGPALSKNGLSLYFGSTRDGGAGGSDLWVARRPCRECPWGEAVNLDMLNTEFSENVPSLSRDDHWLFFNSNRPGGFGGNDIWASYREHVHDDFGWGPPINLGPGVNTAAGEAGAGYFENEGGAPQLFFGRAAQIHVSELQPDGTWGEAIAVAGLENDHPDFLASAVLRPSLAPNGREMFFFSNSRIWYATRETLDAPWEVAHDPVFQVPDEATGGASNVQPHIHWHGRTETLLLVGFPPTGPDGLRLGSIYMSTRTRGATPAR